MQLPPDDASSGIRGPVDASVVPRFAGIATFARLPRLDEVGRADVAIVGVPFDSGVSYRPGARFGPAHVREASRLLRPYNPAQDVFPFGAQQPTRSTSPRPCARSRPARGNSPSTRAGSS